jgi:hypothetical protein
VKTSIWARSFESTSSPRARRTARPCPLVARQDQPLHLRERADGSLAPNRVEHRRRLEVLCTTQVNARKCIRKEGMHVRTVPSPSRWTPNMRMAPWWPMCCSVMHTICSSSSEKDTFLTAVGNSHTKRHSPVCTDQSCISLSAGPETRKRDCAAYEMTASWGRSGLGRRGGSARVDHAQSTSIVQLKWSGCSHCMSQDARRCERTVR